jgi:hypothetical protein
MYISLCSNKLLLNNFEHLLLVLNKLFRLRTSCCEHLLTLISEILSVINYASLQWWTMFHSAPSFSAGREFVGGLLLISVLTTTHVRFWKLTFHNQHLLEHQQRPEEQIIVPIAITLLLKVKCQRK